MSEHYAVVDNLTRHKIQPRSNCDAWADKCFKMLQWKFRASDNKGELVKGGRSMCYAEGEISFLNHQELFHLAARYRIQAIICNDHCLVDLNQERESVHVARQGRISVAWSSNAIGWTLPIANASALIGVALVSLRHRYRVVCKPAPMQKARRR